jgi:hypothetical protein
MNSHAKRVARLEEAAGAQVGLPTNRRHLLELFTLATLRRDDEPCPHDFDHSSDAELLRIVGATPEEFDTAMRDLGEARRLSDYTHAAQLRTARDAG